MVLVYAKKMIKKLDVNQTIHSLNMMMVDLSHNVILSDKNMKGGFYEIEDCRHIRSGRNSSYSIDNNIGNSKHRKFYHNKFSMLNKGIAPVFLFN